MDLYEQKQIVHSFICQKILISPETINHFNPSNTQKLLNNLKQIPQTDFLLLYKELLPSFLEKKEININWKELDKCKSLTEKKGTQSYPQFLDTFLSEKTHLNQYLNNSSKNTQILKSFKEEPKKREIQSFVELFNHRYTLLRSFLQSRPELTNPISIKRIKERNAREESSLIGIVKSKRTTKNGNILFELEDQTGSTNVLVNKNRPNLFSIAENILEDEVIGIKGSNGENIIFTNNIVLPDLPIQELKKAEEETYALFLSDFHVGSKQFLPDNFNKFLDWISGKIGNNTQKEIARKVKYIFIVGDLVDGVGIYPNQEEELEIKDIVDQYNQCAEFLKRIPSNIDIIACPGNHDASHIAEPQPPFYKEFARAIYELPNITIVSNPSLVNIHSSKNFDGFNVLMYHGYSFDFYVANVGAIRNQGGYDRADLIMKHILQRRHLAPTYTSAPYIPKKEDPLVIEKIPDFFATGHIHKCSVSSYKNITLICGSCWQSKTSFQEKVGHHPEPARVPIVNLKTRAIKILRF